MHELGGNDGLYARDFQQRLASTPASGGHLVEPGAVDATVAAGVAVEVVLKSARDAAFVPRTKMAAGLVGYTEVDAYLRTAAADMRDGWLLADALGLAKSGTSAAGDAEGVVDDAVGVLGVAGVTGVAGATGVTGAAGAAGAADVIGVPGGAGDADDVVDGEKLLADAQQDSSPEHRECLPCRKTN